MANVPDDINVRIGDEFKIEFGFIATEEGLHTVAIFKGADRHHLQIINAFRSEI